jgi:hypothetical protein
MVVAIGMAALFGAYTLGIWGYCRVNGYDVTFTSLFGTTWTSAAQAAPSSPLPLPADPGTGTTLL